MTRPGMSKYRILPEFGAPLDKGIVAPEALRVACRELEIPAPKLFLVERDQVLGTLEAPSGVWGWSDQTTRSIYILADLPLNDMVHVVFHEAHHIADTRDDHDPEEWAEEFARNMWESHRGKTRLVEILRALEEVATPSTRHPSHGATVVRRRESMPKPRERVALGIPSNGKPKSPTAQRKLDEIRTNYHEFLASQAGTMPIVSARQQYNAGFVRG